MNNNPFLRHLVATAFAFSVVWGTATAQAQWPFGPAPSGSAKQNSGNNMAKGQSNQNYNLFGNSQSNKNSNKSQPSNQNFNNLFKSQPNQGANKSSGNKNSGGNKNSNAFNGFGGGSNSSGLGATKKPSGGQNNSFSNPNSSKSQGLGGLQKSGGNNNNSTAKNSPALKKNNSSGSGNSIVGKSNNPGGGSKPNGSTQLGNNANKNNSNKNNSGSGNPAKSGGQNSGGLSNLLGNNNANKGNGSGTNKSGGNTSKPDLSKTFTNNPNGSKKPTIQKNDPSKIAGADKKPNSGSSKPNLTKSPGGNNGGSGTKAPNLLGTKSPSNNGSGNGSLTVKDGTKTNPNGQKPNGGAQVKKDTKPGETKIGSAKIGDKKPSTGIANSTGSSTNNGDKKPNGGRQGSGSPAPGSLVKKPPMNSYSRGIIGTVAKDTKKTDAMASAKDTTKTNAMTSTPGAGGKTTGGLAGKKPGNLPGIVSTGSGGFGSSSGGNSKKQINGKLGDKYAATSGASSSVSKKTKELEKQTGTELSSLGPNGKKRTVASAGSAKDASEKQANASGGSKTGESQPFSADLRGDNPPKDAIDKARERIADSARSAKDNAEKAKNTTVTYTAGGRAIVSGTDASQIPRGVEARFQGKWVTVGQDGRVYEKLPNGFYAQTDQFQPEPLASQNGAGNPTGFQPGNNTQGNGQPTGQLNAGGGEWVTDPNAAGFFGTYQPKNVGEAILIGVASALQQASADGSLDFAGGGYGGDYGGGDGGFSDSGAFEGGGGGYGGGYVESSGYIVGDDGGMAANSAPVQQPVPVPAVTLVKPRKNLKPNQVTVADRSVAKKIGAQIDAKLSEDVEVLTAMFEPRAFSDVDREQMTAALITPEMDKVVVGEFNGAAIDLDPEGLSRAAKKLGIAEQKMAKYSNKLKLSHALKQIKQVVNNEDSAERVAAFRRRLQTSLREVELDRAERTTLNESVDAITESLQIRLAAAQKPSDKPGSLVAAPQGEVPIVYYPPLAPAGKVFLLGDEVLAVGTASKGSLVLGNADAKDVLETAKANGNPVENIDLERAKVAPHSGTLVLNPPESGTALSYTINDYVYSLEPGQSQVLPAGTTWVIAFDKGTGKEAKYTLGEGTYAFKDTGDGWDLAQKKFSVTLENPSLTGRFFLVIDNEPAAIPAGRALELTSPYPVVVGFDRGDGEAPAYKKLLDGTYAASVNAEDNLWDLFVSNSADEPEGTEQVATRAGASE